MENKNKLPNGVAWGIFIIVSCVGIAFATWTRYCEMFTDIDEELSILIFAAVASSGGALVGLITVLISGLLLPYLHRRRTALKALGKNGLRIVAHDEAARYAYKGIYSLLKGDYVNAEKNLQTSLSKSDVRQNQQFCVEWLINMYENNDNSSKVMWGYRKAAELAPDNPDVLTRLGHAYFSQGNLDKAQYYFEQALRYDANFGYSYYSLVKIYIIRGEDDKARETFDKLLKVNENHPLAHAELAMFHAMQGDAEKAEEHCKKANLCGYKQPDDLNRRVKAILEYGQSKGSPEDLPSLYYRRIEKPSEKGEKGQNA